ncbi:MAG: hypothetical protein ABJF10_07730 [Chthoniobacter sp.]|uniref:hypothetical protein n=1 Tax=Chthoniobacter sp. TaxID=2510640 RepID=UPI0032A95E1C
MAEEDIPLEIRQFVWRHIRSVEQLEILVLLWSKPNAGWSVQTVYDIVLSSKPSVEQWLEEFVRLGVFEKTTGLPPTFSYVATGETAAQFEALARLYKTKPVRVIETIFRRDRDPAQGFADAFKIKNKP